MLEGVMDFDVPVPWSPEAYYLVHRPSFTLDPFFHAGLYYVQDPSAMVVGWVFRHMLEKGCAHSRVLDLCAAPGGKTTDISASLGQDESPYLLVANELVHQRALALCDNVARWGDPNVVVTNSDPVDFKGLGSFFDIVVADVPCSGEGMFRKSENARNMWSEDNVNLCARRQRRIIADVWDSLKEGGVLIYSTCTLNETENDENVRWIRDELGGLPIDLDFPFEGPRRTEFGLLMVPGEVRGEGQYVAALVKGSSLNKTESEDVYVPEFQFFDKNDEIYALPLHVASDMPLLGKRLKVLNAGVHAFTVKGKNRIPYADLALCPILQDDDFPDVALSRQDALRFLHKDAIRLSAEAPEGYLTVSYEGYKLGFVKNLGNRANNLHPAARRIMMNVE